MRCGFESRHRHGMKTHIQVSFTKEITSTKGLKWIHICDPDMNSRGDFDGVKETKNLEKSNCSTCNARKSWVVEELSLLSNADKLKS